MWLEDEEKVNRKRIMDMLDAGDMDQFTQLKDFEQDARNKMAMKLDGYANSLSGIPFHVTPDKLEQAKALLADPKFHTLDTLLKTLLSPAHII